MGNVSLLPWLAEHGENRTAHQNTTAVKRKKQSTDNAGMKHPTRISLRPRGPLYRLKKRKDPSP